MDALEQRVQALEQELQILKNEIQSILLDIQEQVLSNTYPGLRSGDSLPQGNPTPPRPHPEPEEVTRPAAPVRKVSFNDFNDDFVDEPPVFEAPPANSKGRRNRIEDNFDDDHWQVMADLEEWAKRKIELIGVQETADLIRTNTIKGRFTPEERDALIDFVVLHVNSHPDAPTQPHRPTIPFESAARPPQNARAETIPAPPAPPAKAAPKPKQLKAKAAPVQPAKPTPAKTKPQPKSEKSADEKESLVLRLIAGVQNAGAGVRWGKHDG